ncbi:MAG: tetratricopeptide repeat protein [Bacteroidales bacterium]
MKGLEKIILSAIILIGSCFHSQSQQTMIYKEPYITYRLAMDLFEKEKYAMAREEFQKFADQIQENTSPIKARAEYLAAVCGYELHNNNVSLPFEAMLSVNDVSTNTPFISLELGKLEYRKGNFQKAVQYLERLNRKDLEENFRDEYFFKLGYSYLKINDIKKSDKTLALITNPSSVYISPATYFRAHIAYLNKDYKKATEGFNKLRDDETFKNIVPYYITQIYYLEGNYDDLLKTAPALLSSASVKRGPEIARMIGKAHYQNKNFREALPYLENYFEKTKTAINREDYYELAYTEYKNGLYERAVGNFNNAVGESDTLSQNAFYHLGDCYLKTNQKKFALNAFHSAYKEGFSFAIKEDALFNYAKLSYELSYNPYNEAVRALKSYLEEYPESGRTDEANTYLVNLYISTKSYSDAIKSIESIKNPDRQLREAYQRLNYYRGIEEFNDGKYESAEKFFHTASKLSEDKSITASSQYWLAECSYRRNDFQIALEQYKKFQTTPGSFTLKEYVLSDYNIGYCYFKQKEYDKAILSFRKLVTNKDKVDSRIVNDGLLRAGDCYFVNKNYPEAISYYDQAYKLKKADGDYALYQKSLAQGAAGMLKEKATTLDVLHSSFPKSTLQPQARYELGLTYLNLQDESKALQAFNSLMNNFPNSHFVKDALLRTGLIYYNQDDNEKALATFKKVVTDFPGTPESKEALMSIRNIYVDLNKVDDFFVYAKNLPFANVTDAEQDSITYLAAENQYMARDCNSAIQGFRNYLDKFKKGAFTVQSKFYMAECLFRNNQPDEALDLYVQVIGEARSKFTETALLNSSAIYFSKKNYDKALEYYRQLQEIAEIPLNRLTAQTGVMRCTYLLGKHEEAIVSSQALIINEQSSVELITEAHLTQAKSAMELKQIPLAQTEFEKTYKLAKNEKGAEAKFNLAIIAFNQENFKEAEKLIFEFINEFPSYDYWLARNFILLADVYIKTGNNIQAKQTLQSIIDNYEGADLVEIAQIKMNTIIAAEKLQEQLKEEEARKAAEKVQEQDIIKIEQENLIDNK